MRSSTVLFDPSSTAADGVFVALLLCSLAAMGSGMVTQDVVSMEASPIDCASMQTEIAHTTFKVLNASLTLLPYDIGGISLLWLSIVNISEVISGSNSTRVPAFWARRVLSKNSGMTSNHTDCRLFQLTAATQISAPYDRTMQFRYNWTHDDNASDYTITAPAAYDVELFSVFTGKGSDVASFRTTLFLSDIWPQLVAVRQAPQCNTSVVTISFLPDTRRSVEMQYTVGLESSGAPINTLDLNYQPEISATLENVTNGTYGIFIAYVASKITQDGCLCGEDEDGTLCYTCGNRVAHISYDVTSGMGLRPWQGPITGLFTEVGGRTCLNVSFSSASSYFGFVAYNITASYENSTSLLLSTVLQDTGDQSVQWYTRCELDSKSVVITVTPIGRCPSYIATVSHVVHFDSPPKTDDSPLLTTGVIVGVVFVCVLVVGLSTVLAVGRQKGWLLLLKKGLMAKTACTYRVSQIEGASSQFTDAFSVEGLPSFIGGRSPAVLLLYADDHELHVKIVTSLAEMLQTFGGVRVIFDKWCEVDEVQHNDWLVKHLNTVEKIIVVVSDAACILYEAFMEAQDYPKYSLKFSSSLHISHALTWSKIYPSLRQKLVFVSYAYSTQASISALTDGFPGQPKYRLFDEMSELVGTLHSEASAVTWSCHREFNSSEKLRLAKRLVSKMVNKVSRHPRFVAEALGPVADRFDSGVSCSPAALPWHTGMEPSTGRTEIFTIYDSAMCDPSSVSSWLDSGFRSSADDERKQQPRLPLPTAIPAAEALWDTYTYIEPEPSIAGSLTSEQLRIALQRLNSEEPLVEGHYSDGSVESCITISDQSWHEPADGSFGES